MLHCNDLTSLMPFSQVSDHRDDDDDNDDIPVVSVNVIDHNDQCPTSCNF